MCFPFKKLDGELPFPEEKPDYKRNVGNTNLASTIMVFFVKYEVPEKNWDFFNGVRENIQDTEEMLVELDGSLFYLTPDGQVVLIPAGTVSQLRLMKIRPEFTLPGIYGHEFCHPLWDMLTDDEEIEFQTKFNELRLIERSLLKKAWDLKPYMRTTIVEAHADTYRYLGKYMPNELKPYYTMLF